MCTSLLYNDLLNAVYAGRTLELPVELPYLVSFLPKGTKFGSQADQHHPISFESKHAILGITVPNGSLDDLKVVEGINEAGLNFSLLAFAGADGPLDNLGEDENVLSAIDLGAWALGLFSTVEEVKAALETETVLVAPLPALGGERPPFHYTVHDRSGASIVIEFADGKRTVYDNPVGVMTNGPKFDWHLENLNNYTFLSNIDRSNAEFRGQSFAQPDSGIATAGLPASDTSVGRFVRAVYYAHFAEKAKTPDQAIHYLGHIMNKFDRPRGATVYTSEKASTLTESAGKLMGPAPEPKPDYLTEYTSWTTLSDLNRNLVYVRCFDSLNYTCLDMSKFSSQAAPKSVPLSAITAATGDASAALLTA